jgi:dipeptidyl aminopeptidase/acylaminoacyl peptidase
MKKQLALVALGLVAALVLAGRLAHAAAGPGPADVQDSLPFWRADGVHLAFERTAPGLQHVVTMTSAGKELYIASQAGVSRGYAGAYFLVESNGVTVVTAGGRYAGPSAILHGTHASAAPDGSRIAYARDGTLYVASLAAVPSTPVFPTYSPPERAIATGIEIPSWDVVGPAWSPDGTRVAVASGSSLLAVNVDGSGSRVLFTGDNQSVDPSWNADGTVIAFERNFAPHWQIWTVRADGTAAAPLLSGSKSSYRYPQFSPFGSRLAFVSDRGRLVGGATQYQFALYTRDLAGGAIRKLVDDVHPYSPPRWSPTGALIAVAAGQECRRWGIYVVRSDGGKATRRSNLCRFDGTPGDDVIHGSPYFDRINGLGGDDRLYGYRGDDAIAGGSGDDVIYGDAGNDFVFGGPGDDVIHGGAGNDTIIGGNGRDRIDCGPGVDTVEGAGPLDRIARNCEHVRH